MMHAPSDDRLASREPIPPTRPTSERLPMSDRGRPATALVAPTLALLPAGCEHAGGTPKADSASAKKAAPAKVEKLPGEADLTTITLTPEAETRLGLAT